MSEPASLREVERELDRVVDRLMSMPLAKASPATPDVMSAADALLDHCRRIDPQVPADAVRKGSARLLGVTFRSLRYRMERQGID